MEEKERHDAGSGPENVDDVELTKTHTGPSTEKSETSSATRFEPIKAVSHHRRSTETLSTLRRERSNNGWGVDDIDETPSRPGSIIAPYNHPSQAGEHDEFEVGWEGGDSDPLSPRSMPTWRKWVIIVITSIGSFCV
jgi:hypothetical protein